MKFRRTEHEVEHLHGDHFFVHRGFLAAWDEISERVKLELSQRDLSSKPLAITGHSLGGALSCIAASELWDLKPVLVTFGQPRVGGREFGDFLERECSRYHRYVYRGDLICHVPVGFGYRHGGLQFYMEMNQMRIEPSIAYTLSRNALRFFRRGKDHNMDNYRTALLRHMTGAGRGQ